MFKFVTFRMNETDEMQIHNCIRMEVGAALMCLNFISHFEMLNNNNKIDSRYYNTMCECLAQKIAIVQLKYVTRKTKK